MISKRSEMSFYQSIFYRDNYHKMLNWLLLEAVIILGLIAAILLYVFFVPATHYYITTTSGQILLLPKES